MKETLNTNKFSLWRRSESDLIFVSSIVTHHMTGVYDVLWSCSVGIKCYKWFIFSNVHQLPICSNKHQLLRANTTSQTWQPPVYISHFAKKKNREYWGRNLEFRTDSSSNSLDFPNFVWLRKLFEIQIEPFRKKFNFWEKYTPVMKCLGLEYLISMLHWDHLVLISLEQYPQWKHQVCNNRKSRPEVILPPKQPSLRMILMREVKMLMTNLWWRIWPRERWRYQSNLWRMVL